MSAPISSGVLCDAACPALASAFVLLESGGMLAFCRHHMNLHEPAIHAQQPESLFFERLRDNPSLVGVS